MSPRKKAAKKVSDKAPASAESFPLGEEAAYLVELRVADPVSAARFAVYPTDGSLVTKARKEREG